MEENCEFRDWDELIPDALGLIFRHLSLQDILTVIPRVCKSWGKAVKGPYCWQEIDIEQWSEHCLPENLDRMLQMLITRSSGSLRKLCVTGVSNKQMFLLIADHAKYLHTLQLPRSKINDSIVEEVAGRLSAVTLLDVSYCRNIGAPALEAIGKHCKSLTGLRRIMHPLDLMDKLSQDDEALAIASTMPKLKNLEMAYMLINTSGVREILLNCHELELLDLRGCWNVKLDKKFVQKFSRLKIVGPHVIDSYEMNGWDECSNYSGSSNYLAWDFVAGDLDYYDDDDDDDDNDDDIGNGFWEDEQSSVEMTFYGFEFDNGGFDWPPSP